MPLYVIRENNTGSYCTSQRHRTFSTVLDEAATFVSVDNARKAIKQMFNSKLDPVYKNWVLTDAGQSTPFYNGDLAAYVDHLRDANHQCRFNSSIEFAEERTQELRCDLEVVEVTLTLV